MNKFTRLNVGIVAACLTGALIAGCSGRTPEQVTSDAAKEVLSTLTYAKDTHGICYATMHSITYAVVSLTAVPCDRVGL